jgi:hypothetical protein
VQSAGKPRADAAFGMNMTFFFLIIRKAVAAFSGFWQEIAKRY